MYSAQEKNRHEKERIIFKARLKKNKDLKEYIDNYSVGGRAYKILYLTLLGLALILLGYSDSSSIIENLMMIVIFGFLFNDAILYQSGVRLRRKVAEELK